MIDRSRQVEREWKGPKETSSKAKIAHVPFSDQPIKKLLIPQLFDDYNHNIGAVDEHNNITFQNASLRPVVKGGYQVMLN